ncbi:MAG: hypothetical protein C0490_00965 [Marivirga sp.]|nr:hypothetical protein [Marivirga sp.]
MPAGKRYRSRKTNDNFINLSMHPLVLLHGSVKPLPKSNRLHAGKLNLQYENGFLRYIRIGETEVLRMINHYIRDENWTTIPMVITAEKIENNKDSFSISYTAECNQGNIQFRWNCSILGKADSSITFNIEGVALTAFKRNRLGFTVLHPIETCAGKECVILHSDNTKVAMTFPEFVSPHQPFLDVTAMYWKPSEEIDAQVHFIGDVFETEDQRNWTDDSFKTYCTPLSKAFPVLVKRGDVVSQTIHFKAATKRAIRKQEERLTFTVDKHSRTVFPKIGLPLSNLSHDETSVQHIQKLGTDFIRLELKGGSDITRQLERALLFNLPLEIVLFMDKNFSFDWLNKLLTVKDKIIHFIILPAAGKCTDQELIDRIVPSLRENFPNCKIGGGTDAFFTQLNRERTPATLLDFLSFSINPQAHAFDVSTLTENLKPQRDVVKSCRTFAEGKDIHVGPVTFRMRWNPSATTNEAKKSVKGILPDNVDSRQVSLYGAAWMLGSIKYLAESGVSAITYFETAGWLGLIQHKEQLWPPEFLWNKESVYPVYVLLREILRHRTKNVVRLIANDPLKVDGLALAGEDGKYIILLANYTEQDQRLSLPNDILIRRYRILDSTGVQNSMLNPEAEVLFSKTEGTIVLPPFAIVVME